MFQLRVFAFLLFTDQGALSIHLHCSSHLTTNSMRVISLGTHSHDSLGSLFGHELLTAFNNFLSKIELLFFETCFKLSEL